MKRILSLALVTAFLVLALPARADEGHCPMMTLKHSKELGLSKKQKSEIEKIQGRMMEEMKALKAKASGDIDAVLTEKQRKKAAEMDMGCPMMGKGGDCAGECSGDCPMKKGGHDGKHGGECPMRD
jgi:hypothetical protein